MKDFRRLLPFVQPYWPPLILSVLLMAIAGAAHAAMAVLIGPIFDRVLDPKSADKPVELFRIPWSGQPVFLQQFFPESIHNVWTLVAISILVVFLLRGLCDYFGNYLVNWTGINAITDIRQTVYNKLLRHDAQFFDNQ